MKKLSACSARGVAAVHPRSGLGNAASVPRSARPQLQPAADDALPAPRRSLGGKLGPISSVSTSSTSASTGKPMTRGPPVEGVRPGYGSRQVPQGLVKLAAAGIKVREESIHGVRRHAASAGEVSRRRRRRVGPRPVLRPRFHAPPVRRGPRSSGIPTTWNRGRRRSASSRLPGFRKPPLMLLVLGLPCGRGRNDRGSMSPTVRRGPSVLFVELRRWGGLSRWLEPRPCRHGFATSNPTCNGSRGQGVTPCRRERARRGTVGHNGCPLCGTSVEDSTARSGIPAG